MKFLLSLTLLFFLCGPFVVAQDRRISLEGTSFTVNDLIKEIESQTDIRIMNRSVYLNGDEELGSVTSPEMVREAVDQMLAGTDFVFQSSAVYSLITIERQSDSGDRVTEQVFVDATTGRVVRIDDVFGQNVSLVGRDVTISDMIVGQVLSGNVYTYHSSGIYTVITAVVDDAERRVIVDMTTGQVLSVESMLQRMERLQHAGYLSYVPYTFPGSGYLPRFSLKTNLLYGATTTVNLGMEFRLNDYLTLDISGGWNPFVYTNNKKFAHWMIQPTVRYWFQEPFNKHFLGMSLMYSNFNVGGLDLPFGVIPALSTHRYRGDVYSVSLQYGHQWILSPRWSIEASLNAGYMFLDYQRFECGWCGDKLSSEKLHYLGPTNAAVSLIYIIK